MVAAARPDGKSTAVVREQLAEWLDADMDFTSFDGGRGTSQGGAGVLGILGWVERTPWELWTMCHLIVSVDSG